MADLGILILRVAMRLLGFVTLLSPLMVALHFADHFGPHLRAAALWIGLAMVVLAGALLFAVARNNATKAWRLCCALFAAPVFATIYFGTGERWPMDRALAFGRAEDLMQNIQFAPDAPPETNALWLAEVTRDYRIAKAQYDYEITVARTTGSGGRLVPPIGLAVLAVIGVSLAALALVPRVWIEEALGGL